MLESIKGAGLPNGSRSTVSNRSPERRALASRFTTRIERLSLRAFSLSSPKATGSRSFAMTGIPHSWAARSARIPGSSHQVKIVCRAEYIEQEDGCIPVYFHPPVIKDRSISRRERFRLILSGYIHSCRSLDDQRQFHQDILDFRKTYTFVTRRILVNGHVA